MTYRKYENTKPEFVRTDDTSKQSTTSLAPTNADPFAFGQVNFKREKDEICLEIRIDCVFVNGDYPVKVNGKTIGMIKVNTYGFGELHLDSSGELRVIHSLCRGDVVEVYNSADILILSGTVSG